MFWQQSTPQKLSEAPAIAAVITAEQIRNMGARDIIDVLRQVPGIGVTKGYFGLEEIEVRGIKTVYSEKVKLLIDGHSVNVNANGNATWFYDGLSVDNVKRVEVVRGPGSALYGSNAFSAVINVVTKDGKDIDGVIVTGGGGGFDTGRVNIQAGKKWDNLDVAFFLDYFETDGARLHVNSDVIGGSGYTLDFEDKLEMGLKLAYNDWTFNSNYTMRERGPYLGAAYALNDESEVDTSQYFAEITYKHNFRENITLTTKLYIDEIQFDAIWELYPEGTTRPTGFFPDGMIANPSIKEKTAGGELQLDYKLLNDNLLTIGALREEREQYAVDHHTNYHPIFFTPLPSGNVEKVNLLGNWNQEKTRDIWAVYLQDLWNITEDIDLTLGARHDNYSDFGDTTNPRAALVWNFTEKWDAKVLYGKAFRAPSFVELYNINNPSVLGNPDLRPETIETYEVSLGYSATTDTMGRISYFKNTFKDKIQLAPQAAGAVFENTGGADIWGIEAEWKRTFSKNNYAYLNYTYQKTEDKVTGRKLADVPSHKGNVGLNVKISDHFNVNTNVFISGKRPREAGDLRDEVHAYALVDLTIIAKEFYQTLEIRGAVHNLLNKEYVDPAPAGTVSNDFPREGRSFMLEGMYKW